MSKDADMAHVARIEKQALMAMAKEVRQTSDPEEIARLLEDPSWIATTAAYANGKLLVMLIRIA